MKTAAFFDVDYTLINGSTSSLFLFYLFKKGKVSIFLIIKSIYYLMLYKFNKLSYDQMSKKLKMPFIQNQNSKYIKDLSQEFFEKILKKKINKNALRNINEHKNNRHKIVLSTASLDFIIRPLADYLGADLISTKTEIKNNFYSGKLIGKVCYGKNKAKKVNEYSNKKNIDLDTSYAYSDHVSDIEFLKEIGNSYLVNPNKKLKKIAEKNNINIIVF
jgi:HAD superfamily hydrolase (TIGR01490 family)